MFSGIVEEIGTIRRIDNRHLEVNAQEVLNDLKIGHSIAINGVCLTVTHLTGGGFTVDIMPETLRRTDLGMLHAGTAVNVERALSAQGRIGGHFVQGHIDGTGRVRSLIAEDESVLMQISHDAELSKYIVTKGFIAVDGVSLTVVSCAVAAFTVSLVNFTRKSTTLGQRHIGDSVNLEVDIIAKYLEKYSQQKKESVLLGFLQDDGQSG